MEADLSINNSVILDDMNEYINKHHDKSRAKKFYIFFHNCWDEKLLMADDKMMSVVARWGLIKFFLLIRHENCVENCWVSYIGCQLNGRYLFLSASLWRGIHESKGRHSLLSTHEDLFGGVIICWFLRWMECVVGNEKTIILIMTWFCTNQALLGCLVLHHMQKDCDIQCMQYSGCNWGCDYLHGSELLILLNLYKWVGWDVMAVGHHNNTNM